jgi:hypothetical protein
MLGQHTFVLAELGPLRRPVSGPVLLEEDEPNRPEDGEERDRETAPGVPAYSARETTALYTEIERPLIPHWWIPVGEDERAEVADICALLLPVKSNAVT